MSRSCRGVPSATYRLQFNREFTFSGALSITAYLHELGISHCYCSPLFEARPESTHGYDICAFDRLNPRLGTADEFARFIERVHEFKMGVVLDMVPNHMAADLCNPWWRDVLQNGENSPFAHWFDIEWEPAEPGLHHRVLLPILEDRYPRVLESGKLRVVFERGCFGLRFHERELPLSPASCAELEDQLREHCAENSAVPAGRASKHRRFDGCSPDPSGMTVLLEHAPAADECLEAFLGQLNGTVGDPESFGDLHALLEKQHYRLAYWRTGVEGINYRRFFDVSELVSLRMELPEVFEATHKLALELVAEGKIDGLRIDHPDGLWAPGEYFRRLEASCVSARQRWLGPSSNPGPARNRRLDDNCAAVYVVVEKILTGNEQLPADWPVDGTTGYEFLNLLNGLFVNRAHESALTSLYHEVTGETRQFGLIVEHSKKQVLSTSFYSELSALTRRLWALASRSRQGRDFTFRELSAALYEIVAAFPVYRTYVNDPEAPIPEPQLKYIQEAVARARQTNQSLDVTVLEFIENVLSKNFPCGPAEGPDSEWLAFVMKFQQLTGPVMAKGLEDTAFYNYNLLISLNEVGGDPESFGTELAVFHQHNATQAAHWPHSLLATATHDTKRGEDARARINVLSEMPDEWRQTVLRWQALNEKQKRQIQGRCAPHPNDEYLLYQTLLGIWPNDDSSGNALDELQSRIANYMRKAMREAKARTSWTTPDAAYEEAVTGFVERVLTSHPSNQFLREFRPFQRRLAFFGKLNSLSQMLLKMTSPGVPDFYQGTELWDLNLVDPDNRRPVDYRLRERLLGDLRQRFESEQPDTATLLAELLQTSDTGQVKLYLVWRTLQFRLRNQELFARGGYTPVGVSGERANHVCAFSRSLGQQAVLVVTPRLLFGLTAGAEKQPLGREVWHDTLIALPADLKSRLRNVLTGEVIGVEPNTESLTVADVLKEFPVAVLEKVGEN